MRSWYLAAICLCGATVAHGFERPYETVNQAPQFAADDETFSFYWAVWRGLRPSERDSLGADGGVLISERSVSWHVEDCNGGVLVEREGERFWYLDEMKLSSDGSLEPLIFGPRRGYRYMNMVTFNALHARRVGPIDSDNYDEWVKRASPRGTVGWVKVEAEHRLYDLPFREVRPEFVVASIYRRASSPLAAQFEMYQPDRWPVFYDERAHKPHSLKAPRAWTEASATSQDNLRLRLEWRWCDGDKKPQVRVFVPSGGLPPPGPNRPERPDGGTSPIEIVEGE